MFSKEVKENLSKYKYIYKIYYNDNTYHIEKYPIIYMNSEYIYFKKPKLKLLDYLKTNYENIYSNIENALYSLENKKNCYYSSLSFVFYIDKYDENIDIKKLKEKWAKEKKEKEIKDKENKLARAKEEYERALKELEEVKNDN